MDGAWFYTMRNIAVFFAAAMLVKYYIFLMLAPWYKVKEALRERRYAQRYHRELGKAPYHPRVSIVIPAWNEEVGIIRSVESLINNTYDNMEIIVVNDGSTDRSHSIMQKYLLSRHAHRRGYAARVRYFYKDNGGKGHALNHAIQRAKGEIIVTMDADSLFARDAIARMVRYFADPSVDAVVGNVRIANKANLIGHMQSLEYMFGFYYKRAHCVLGAEYIYGGACSAFRKSSTFDKFGLFDTSNKTEDIEMSMRTKYFGLKSCYAEDVLCYTEGASTISGLLAQRLRWKKGRFDTFAKYRRMFFSRDKRHRRSLGWFVLPFSLLAELQLLFEPISVTLLVTYSIISNDFVSLALGSLFIAVSYLVVGLFSCNFRPSLLFLYPLTWPLFYVLVWVEYLALMKSVFMSVRGTDIEWQRWDRKGINT